MAQLPEQIGPYKIVAQIGAGGMGQVYRAHDPRLNRDVALKILPAEFSSDPSRRQRFEQEAKAVAALNHPGIVSVYDVGDGWMVTELVDGESLRHSTFTVREVIDIGAQIADALAAAHEAGYAHRDLKPENVLMTTEGRTKILDFGLAKVIQHEDAPPEQASTITNPGSPLGTPGYMAPEQVRGQHSDHRSDIFALGVMLYEMLAGRPPFEAPSAIEVMHAIVHREPEPLPSSVPPRLRTIVARCLEKKPPQRFQSARDLAFALRTLAEPVNGETAAAPAKYRWWPVALASLVALGATATAVYYARVPEPAPPEISLDNYRLRPFAFTRAQEHSGVWSPDSQSVAFVEQNGDGTRLMVQSLNATVPTEIAAGISNESGQLAWSADGTRVFFLRQGSVYAVSRAGGEPERILQNASAFHLSPDGQFMAVWRGSLPADDTAGAGLHYSVWISTSGAEPVEYANGPSVKTPFTPVFLRFSPNNSLLYLSFVNETGSETWLLPFPADSKTPARRVFASTPWNRPVAGSWLADGKRMVLSGNPAPSTGEQLWLADIEKETLTRLTAPGQTSANTPSVSPSGPNSDRILYAQVRRDRDLTEFPLDGSAPRPFLATSLPEYGPSWSPKGDQFAFVTQRTGTDELWVRSAEGKWDRAVVTQRDFSGPLGGPPGGPPTGRSGRGGPSNLQTLVSPSFSPDGERIAYTALRVNADRRRSLAISPAGGGEPTIISDGYAPTWSPDGSTLAFLWLKSDGTLPVATIRVGSDDQPHELVPGPGPSGAPEWSPDGKWIAVPLGFRGVELVSPDGTQRRILPGLENSALLWSLDSKTLYGLTFQAARPALSSMNVATGAVKKIAEYDVSFLPLLDNTYTGSIRMSMSPGGKSFVAATATNQSDLWILDWTARRFGGFKGTDPGKGPKGPPPLPELK